MAKAKTTKAAADTAVETQSEAQVEKVSNDRFIRVFVDGQPAPALKEDKTAKKLAPQAQVIADTLAGFGESGATRKELVAKLEADGLLKTKQPVGRILSYYQKDLITYGVATQVKA
ncbi:hypothetical protein [Caudoviricetes sp.]|nr:hypothetical protein [Caudoviricetes sp.]